jgi:hypothetical protein
MGTPDSSILRRPPLVRRLARSWSHPSALDPKTATDAEDVTPRITEDPIENTGDMSQTTKSKAAISLILRSKSWDLIEIAGVTYSNGVLNPGRDSGA